MISRSTRLTPRGRARSGELPARGQSRTPVRYSYASASLATQREGWSNTSEFQFVGSFNVKKIPNYSPYSRLTCIALLLQVLTGSFLNALLMFVFLQVSSVIRKWINYILGDPDIRLFIGIVGQWGVFAVRHGNRILRPQRFRRRASFTRTRTV